MKIALVQIPLVWESPADNRQAIEQYLDNHDLTQIDLVLLPETFTTGFSMLATHLAESMEGETVACMKRQAQKYQVLLAGSIMVQENGHTYNRFIVAHAEHLLCTYDKRHLFGLGAEQELITAGAERKSFTYNDWIINLQICYDLRFPVWLRNTDEMDLILLVANWPAPRIQAWRSLLVARAIENQCYVVGLNRTGEDGNKLQYTGDSLVVDPTGKILLDAGQSEGVVDVELDLDFLKAFRHKFPFLNDRDAFIIE